MFGRTVIIDGTEIFVTCVPSTPYSEICRRAAKIFEIEERNGKKPPIYRVAAHSFQELRGD